MWRGVVSPAVREACCLDSRFCGVRQDMTIVVVVRGFRYSIPVYLRFVLMSTIRHLRNRKPFPNGGASWPAL